MTGVLDPAFSSTYAPPQGALAPPPAQGVMPPQAAPDYPNAQQISALMETSERAFGQYAREHPIQTRLTMLAAAMNGGPAAMETQRQTLAARQMQPLMLAQQKAQFAGMVSAYQNAKTDTDRSAILTMFPDWMKQQITNEGLQKTGPGEQLQSSQVATPPTPFAKTVGGGAIYDPNTGQWETLPQPQILPPGSAPATFGGPLSGQLGAPTAPAAANGAQPPAPAPSAAPPIPATGGKLNGADFFNNFYAAHEGAVNPSDANGQPSYWGLNRASNPDVKGPLSKADAQQIFTARYFNASGANNMPGPLAAIHADTYALNPGWAKLALAQSGGDPAKYMAVRSQLMQADLQRNPAVRPYAQAWANRNRDLIGYASSLGAEGQPTGAPAGQTAPAAAAAVGPAAPPPAPGWSVNAQGKQTHQLTPDEVAQRNLPPGVYQMDPVGKVDKIADFSKDDTDRLAGVTKALDMAEQLTVSGQRFMGHNARASTGMQYFDPLEEAGKPEHNPLAVMAMHNNPDVSQMEAEHGAQTFLIKNPDIGRILQTEIPFWEAQAQGIDLAPQVNAQRLTEAAKAYQYLSAKHAYMQTWLYGKHSLDGFDPAWNQYWSSITPDTHGGAAQNTGARSGAADPLGIR